MGADCTVLVPLTSHDKQIVTVAPDSWYYFRARYSNNYHTVIKSKNGVRFSVYGVDSQESGVPTRNMYDFKEQDILLYTHFIDFDNDNPTKETSLVAVHNSGFYEAAQLEIEYE